MAEKRMLSTRILNMGNFLQLAPQEQLLYIRLALNADDDGFVDSPVMACRLLGVNQQAVRSLEKQGFLICFPDGPLVITHWHIHNQIRKDRYKPTIFTAQLAQLQVNSVGVYQLRQEDDPPQAEESTPQVQQAKETTPQVQQAVELYRQLCPSLLPCPEPDRQTGLQLAQVLKKEGLEKLEQVFRKAESTPYLRGGGKDGWRAGLPWLIQPGNMRKVLQGQYSQRKPPVPMGCSGLGAAELEAIQKALAEDP